MWRWQRAQHKAIAQHTGVIAVTQAKVNTPTAIATLGVTATPSADEGVVNAKAGLVLDVYRQLQAAAAAGNEQMAPIAFIGYGNGGHNDDNTVKPLDASRTSMFNLVVLKEVSELTQPSLYIARARAIVSGAEIDVISEAALFDSSNRIIAMAVFPPKYTTEGETYGVTMQLRF